jgi:hypothetical protein
MEIFRPKQNRFGNARRPDRAREGDRRRGSEGFRRAYPGLFSLTRPGGDFAVDGWLPSRAKYNHVRVLRQHMTRRRERTDGIVQAEQNKLQIATAGEAAGEVRQEASPQRLRGTASMYLTREGALLREMPVQPGRARRGGIVERSSRRSRAAKELLPTVGHEDHSTAAPDSFLTECGPRQRLTPVLPGSLRIRREDRMRSCQP